MAHLEQLTLKGIPAEGKNTNSHLQTVNHIDEKGGSFIIQKKYRLLSSLSLSFFIRAKKADALIDNIFYNPQLGWRQFTHFFRQ